MHCNYYNSSNGRNSSTFETSSTHTKFDLLSLFMSCYPRELSIHPDSCKFAPASIVGDLHDMAVGECRLVGVLTLVELVSTFANWSCVRDLRIKILDINTMPAKWMHSFSFSEGFSSFGNGSHFCGFSFYVSINDDLWSIFHSLRWVFFLFICFPFSYSWLTPFMLYQRRINETKTSCKAHHHHEMFLRAKMKNVFISSKRGSIFFLLHATATTITSTKNAFHLKLFCQTNKKINWQFIFRKIANALRRLDWFSSCIRFFFCLCAFSWQTIFYIVGSSNMNR